MKRTTCGTIIQEKTRQQPHKAVSDGSYKLLLTATPIELSILNLFGLVNFIDNTVFPDEKEFYQRYFRRPENYPELSYRASKYCFRTLRRQVSDYVKFTNRIPIVAEYTVTELEQELYSLLEAYLEKACKIAYPKIEQYDLTLKLTSILSSSTIALAKTLAGAISTLEKQDQSRRDVQEELEQLIHMEAFAERITVNAKAQELLKAIKIGFEELEKVGAQKKAIVFADNLMTQAYLYATLEREYRGGVFIFNGSKSRNKSLRKKFEKNRQILIATNLAAEGFHFPFCSFVIHYDIPFNSLVMEKRIQRCHRQGQESDVISLCFVNKRNFADVRAVELINKRVLQYDGILGMSDDMLGNFGTDIETNFRRILEKARKKEEIEAAHIETLKENEEQNRTLVTGTEEVLYTTFTKEIADKITITPQYAEDIGKKINDTLWDVVKYFLEGKRDYTCFDDTRTVRIGFRPGKIFTGAHLGRDEYSMTDKSLPPSGRLTLTSALAKNILNEMYWDGIYKKGFITVGIDMETVDIGFYEITVRQADSLFEKQIYYQFTGKTAGGRVLSHKECKRIMELPVLQCTALGKRLGQKDAAATESKPEALDDQIQTRQYIQKMLLALDEAKKEEAERLKYTIADKKAGLKREIGLLRQRLKELEQETKEPISVLEKLKNQKLQTELQRALKKAEESLFFKEMQLDKELEKELERLMDTSNLKIEVKCQFLVTVFGKNNMAGGN